MLYHIKHAIVPNNFCDEVIKQGEEKDLKKAEIQDGKKTSRSSDVSWLDEEKLGTSLTNLVVIANKESKWNFSLKEFEPLQYTIYNKDDYYDWHIDNNNKHDDSLILIFGFSTSRSSRVAAGVVEEYSTMATRFGSSSLAGGCPRSQLRECECRAPVAEPG